MKPRIPFVLAGAVLSLLSYFSNAIIMRHDVDDAEYRNLAKSYDTVVKINLPDGVGTLISPKWVVTAAHVAELVKPGHEITVAGRNYKVERVVLHPDQKDSPGVDIALIELLQPVYNVEPTELYRSQDEAGKPITIVGHYYIGTGLNGPVPTDKVLRAAHNVVSDSYKEQWLRWEFDAPNSPHVLPLEGIAGPGDSGGPAYIESGGKRYLAGVSSMQSTKATNGKEGLYGVTEYYMRISYFADWIDSVIAK